MRADELPGRVSAAHFILYVRDQPASAQFYERALGLRARLDVPGMTEFELGSETGLAAMVLGLMPLEGARRLLGAGAVAATTTEAAPPARCELYLVVADARAAHDRALRAGARELSPVLQRDWGHLAGYCADPDGHVLAFAEAAASLTP